jgi:hypothetical protein
MCYLPKASGEKATTSKTEDSKDEMVVTMNPNKKIGGDAYGCMKTELWRWMMDEKNREYIKRLRFKSEEFRHTKEEWSNAVVENCLAIIDRLEDERKTQHATIIYYREEVEYLKAQLRGIRGAVGPFDEFRRHFPQQDDDYEIACVVSLGSEAKLTVGDFRALAAELNKIKEVDGEG